MKQNKKKLCVRQFLSLLLLLSVLLTGCAWGSPSAQPEIHTVTITNGGRITLEVGNSICLTTDLPEALQDEITWSTSGSAATVDENGVVTAREVGKAAITASYQSLSDSALIEVIPRDEALDDSERAEFYQNYTPADSAEEAQKRSEQGLMSGSLTVPNQAPTLALHQPKEGDLLIRNEEKLFADEDTYIVVDCYGQEILRIYRGGGYITLEEVAAYVYAFGEVPANYVSGKDAQPENSIWGEYLRLNHSKFSGNTKKYPYEPALPNISGCGGDYVYYEIDIGTTGTDCDPAYPARLYNNGHSITRGAARIVYARYDEDGDRLLEPDERYVFYTYNHYNDFQEYLNYYGGWGEIFGNVTGGGKISSKTDYAPTPYIQTVMGRLTPSESVTVYYFDPRKLLALLDTSCQTQPAKR